MATSREGSSSPSPGEAARGDVPVTRTISASSAKEGISLKRVREGSMEPTAEADVPTVPPISTKKNRLAVSSSSSSTTKKSPRLASSKPLKSPNEIAVDDSAETGNVGEVRRKVEKMTYDEEEGAGGQEVEIPELDEDEEGDEGRQPGSAMSMSTTGRAAREEEEVNGGVAPEDEKGEEASGEGWEEIEKDEVAEMRNDKQIDAEEEHDEEEGEEGKTDGLKRKALDRSESSFAKDDGEGVKRQKETPPPADVMANPAVQAAEPSAATPASADSATLAAESAPAKKPQASFASFSSAASPFAARSGSPFAAASGSASPFASAKPGATSAFGGGSSGTAGAATPSKPSPFASSGFGNYSSSFSPFAAKKANALDAASGAKKVDGEDKAAEDKEEGEEGSSQSKAGPSSFGDILEKGGTGDGGEDEDHEEKVKMTEKDVHTGEEEEETMYQTRSKLYVMQTDGGWRERGVGMIKLNVRRSDGKGARLVMRAEGVLRLILNVSLYAGMSCLEDGKHVRLTVFEDGERRLITIRTGSAKAAAEFASLIHEHIPLEASKSPDPEAGKTA